MEYTKAEVENKSIIDLHVRSSSEKEPIDMNKRTIAFFLHENNMYFWCEGKSKLKKVNNDFTIRSEKFERLNDNNIMLFTEHFNDKNELTFCLRQIIVEFSMFDTKYVY